MFPTPLRRPRSARDRRVGLARPVLFVAVALGFGVLDLGTAVPAAADGVGPTNFESVVDEVSPATPSVAVEVVGGDAFLRVRVDPGTDVLVPGYDSEPYLWIAPDGTVYRNEYSSAKHLNSSKFGTGEPLPQPLSGGADRDTVAPLWMPVGSGGEVAWHDHRIHWMATQQPDAGGDGVVQTWTVPLMVDGSEVVVSGRLLLRGDEFPWAALLALGVGVGAVLAARRVALRVPLLAVAAALAVALSFTSFAANPPDAGASVVPFLLALAALGLSLGALAMPATRHPLVLPLATVAALTGWVIGRIGTFWMPVVPSAAPPALERIGTGLVAGLALGVATAVVLWPSRTVSVHAHGTRPGDPWRPAG